MSRIYQTQVTGVGYQGASRGGSFSPEIAASSVKEAQQYGDAAIQDAIVLGRDISRQLQLEHTVTEIAYNLAATEQRLSHFNESANQKLEFTAMEQALARDLMATEHRLADSQLVRSGEFQLSQMAQKNTLDQAQLGARNTLTFAQQGQRNILDSHIATAKAILSGKQQTELNIAKLADAAAMGRMQLAQQKLQLQAQVQSARTQAIGTAIQGLVSLAQTGIKIDQTIKAEQAKQADIDAQADALFGGASGEFSGGDGDFWGGPLPDVTSGDYTAPAYAAETRAVEREAVKYETSGGPIGVSVANAARQQTAWQQTNPSRVNLYSAQMQLIAAWPELAGQIRPGAEGVQDVQRVMREFAQRTGILSAPREDVVRVLGPTARSLAINSLNQVNAEQRQATLEVNREKTAGQIYDLAGSASVSNIQQTLDSVQAAVTQNDIGFNDGHSARSKLYAVKQLASALQGAGKVEELRALKSAEIVPGNSGTTVGKLYGHLIDAAVRGAENTQLQDFQHARNMDNLDRENIVAAFRADPSPENRQAAINALLQKGDERSTAMAAEMALVPSNYDPRVEARLQQQVSSGQLLTKAELDMHLANGTISYDFYKNNIGSTSESLIDKQLKPYFTGLSGDIQKGMEAQVGTRLNGIMAAQVGNRSEAAAEIVQQNIASRVAAGQISPSDPVGLRAAIEAETRSVLSRPEFSLVASATDPDSTLAWGAPLTGAPVPQLQTGVEDYTSFNPPSPAGSVPPALQNRSQIQENRDIILQPGALRTDMKAVLENRVAEISPLTHRWAKFLGISPVQLIDAQAKAHGWPSLSSMQQQMQRAAQTTSAAPAPIGTNARDTTVSVGRNLVNRGFVIWQHPNFGLNGYVPDGSAAVGTHTNGSKHYDNRALDFPRSHNSEAQLNWLYNYLNQNRQRFGISELMWGPDHDTHLHVAFGQ